MKKTWLFAFILLLLGGLWYFTGGERSAAAANPAKKGAAAGMSCGSCHADFASVLPKGHPPVNNKNLAACAVCHMPDTGGGPQKNPYAARMHLAHIPPKGTLDCAACHSWTPGRSFGLIGVKGSRGAPTRGDMELMKKTFASWASSPYSDHHHAKAGVLCAGCHGKDLPKADATVDNPRCLECHGPMEKLAKKSEPKDFPDRNPHKSHLGDINCTVCHREHSVSKAYCLDCHKKFDMKMPGGEKKK